MWFFYPDIRPLKKAVFHYAVKFDKPILPITMSFRKRRGISRLFTKTPCVDLHIGEPIFPDSSLPVREREEAMHKEAYQTLSALIANGSFPAALQHSGYTADDAITIAQKVEAYNNGAKVAFLGTKKAIYQMLPDASAGYRMITDATNPQINIVRGIFDWDIIEIPQVAVGDDKSYDLALDDNVVYVLSLGAEKPIKGVLEGSTLTNSNDFYDNADLTSSATMNKRWGFAAASNTVMGFLTV